MANARKSPTGFRERLSQLSALCIAIGVFALLAEGWLLALTTPKDVQFTYHEAGICFMGIAATFAVPLFAVIYFAFFNEGRREEKIGCETLAITLLFPAGIGVVAVVRHHYSWTTKYFVLATIAGFIVGVILESLPQKNA